MCKSNRHLVKTGLNVWDWKWKLIRYAPENNLWDHYLIRPVKGVHLVHLRKRRRGGLGCLLRPMARSFTLIQRHLLLCLQVGRHGSFLFFLLPLFILASRKPCISEPLPSIACFAPSSYADTTPPFGCSTRDRFCPSPRTFSPTPLAVLLRLCNTCIWISFQTMPSMPWPRPSPHILFEKEYRIPPLLPCPFGLPFFLLLAFPLAFALTNATYLPLRVLRSVFVIMVGWRHVCHGMQYIYVPGPNRRMNGWKGGRVEDGWTRRIFLCGECPCTY